LCGRDRCAPQILHPDTKILILQDMTMCDAERSCLPLCPALRPCFTSFRLFSKRWPPSSHFMVLATRSRSSLAAENLFLRKQLALFQERQTKPRRATDSTRWLMVVLVGCSIGATL
jgi:hypothetical protein